MTLEPRIFEGRPDGLLDCPAERLVEALGGPALIHIAGACEPALFISVLLHGNEISGWNALRRLLATVDVLPRSLIIFIGNVYAAARGLRVLPGQRDFNRIWRGSISGPEGQLAVCVRDWLRQRALFAAVDLHNNTGHNPHYSVLTRLDGDSRGLAYLFADKAVYIEEPDTVLSGMFDDLCPAVTLELGPVADPMCEERGLDFLQRCLALTAIPAPGDLSLYRTRVRVHVKDGVEFSFADDHRDTPLVLTSGVEGVNFHALPAGTAFGCSREPLSEVLRVLDVAHRDVTDEYFERRGDSLELRRRVVPAMYTTDPVVVMQDCLCYFMEPMEVPVDAAVIDSPGVAGARSAPGQGVRSSTGARPTSGRRG